jgi:hypothetical protein
VTGSGLGANSRHAAIWVVRSTRPRRLTPVGVGAPTPVRGPTRISEGQCAVPPGVAKWRQAFGETGAFTSPMAGELTCQLIGLSGVDGPGPYGTYSRAAPTEVRAGGPTTASRARLGASSAVAALPSADEDHKGGGHQHLQHQGHEPKMKQGTADQSAQERTAYSAQKRPPKTDRVGPGDEETPERTDNQPPHEHADQKADHGDPPVESKGRTEPATTRSARVR